MDGVCIDEFGSFNPSGAPLARCGEGIEEVTTCQLRIWRQDDDKFALQLVMVSQLTQTSQMLDHEDDHRRVVGDTACEA